MTLVNNRPAPIDVAVDPQQWPDIAAAPSSSPRAAVAKALFHYAAARIPLRVSEPDGRSYGGGTAADPLLRLVRPELFFARLGATGTIGFGEAYMAGDWTADDLPGVLAAFAGSLDRLVPTSLQHLRSAFLDRMPSTHDNTLAGARRNIHAHYDLSNALFGTFLDETMSYSSALYSGEPDHCAEPLGDAQRRKIDRLLDAAAVGPGSRVLEIGTGWGELAIRAAQRGASVTSITLSTEQAELARERLDAAGVADRVRIVLQDYRETTGTYDAVVSVEMIEAVGANHWGEYFATIDRRLTPGGRAGLQAILMDDERVHATRETYTWIRKYIFPGGQIPSLEAIQRALRQATSLRIADRLHFGRHYAETLRRWRQRFEAEDAAVGALGFDQVFRRMWSFYLAYSEAGFRTGYLDVAQLLLTKPRT
jgi:cyclopropane-fatty-acyl-phospholipid synthase